MIFYVNIAQKAPMTEWLPPNYKHREEVVHMTAYETVMVVLGTIGLLISFGGLIIALISFLDKKDKK